MSIRPVLSLILTSLVLLAPAILAPAMLAAASTGSAAELRTQGENSITAQTAVNSIVPIGNAFQVSNITSLAEISPDVAYDSTHSEYLAVWFNDRTALDDIMAQRLSKDGSLIGAPFYIASGGEGINRRYPRVVYNVLSDQYLVVWEQQGVSDGFSIQGRRVTWNGVLIDTAAIVIRDAGITLYSPARPAVAYAQTANKYLVVWEETFHPSSVLNIYGQVVLASGSLSGGLVNIAQDDSGNVLSDADLAYNPLANQYLVAWQRYDHGSTLTDIYSRRVTGDGAALGAGPILLAFYTVSSTAPAVAALPVEPSGQYLVVWESHYKSNDSDILGILVGSDGNPAIHDISITSTNNVDQLQPDVVGNPSRNEYLVSWKEVPNPAFPLSTIFAALVTATGSLDGAPFTLGAIVAEHPALASGGSGDYLMVYDDLDFAFDWGTYGWLVGTRVYLPLVKK
jgi:hypothetical protein